MVTKEDIPHLVQALSFLVESDSYEKHIIETLSWKKHVLDIFKVRRSIYPVKGEWFIHNGAGDIIMFSREHNLQERYYWGIVLDDELNLLVDVPCRQERGW